MRLVRVTIEYDMDDMEKSLHDELKDWLNGDVAPCDIVGIRDDVQWATPTTAVSKFDTLCTVRINELDSQGEVK